MKHYRLNKVTHVGGPVVKQRDTLAENDKQAVELARDDADCPICEVWREGKKVGTVA